MLEGGVEAILTPDNAFVYLNVDAMAVFLVRFHIQDLLPHVLSIVVALIREFAVLGSGILSF